MNPSRLQHIIAPRLAYAMSMRVLLLIMSLGYIPTRQLKIIQKSAPRSPRKPGPDANFARFSLENELRVRKSWVTRQKLISGASTINAEPRDGRRLMFGKKRSGMWGYDPEHHKRCVGAIEIASVESTVTNQKNRA
jgi:hypothetical protein